MMITFKIQIHLANGPLPLIIIHSQSPCQTPHHSNSWTPQGQTPPNQYK